MINGMSALFRRRTSVTNRMTGTDTNMMRNAEANPNVMGNPRRTVTARDSFFVDGGALAATASPTATGMMSARVTHTIRMVQEGTRCGIGTKASRRAAIFGATTPNRRIGQATAAPTTIER